MGLLIPSTFRQSASLPGRSLLPTATPIGFRGAGSCGDESMEVVLDHWKCSRPTQRTVLSLLRRVPLGRQSAMSCCTWGVK